MRKIIGENSPLTLRVDNETYDEVVAYARSERISLSEAVRTFVAWGLETVRSGKSSKALHIPPKWC